MEKNKGVTLTELLIVIAIIGILVGIALPSYQTHIQKGNRVAAQLALTKMAQQFERINARQGEYPTGTDGESVIDGIAASDGPDSYTFALTDDAVDTFTITATPVVGGINDGDECGWLRIVQTGATTSKLSGNCW
ncbi:type IV pilin protein [Psychromonas sp.]|uniref:type IV pilin protein n=1 Tax=Psychromonas sp. TaxID=1884585 RepID=UPI00356747E0